jgi:hypothetical protein
MFLSPSVVVFTAVLMKIQAYVVMTPLRFVHFYGPLGDLANSIFRVRAVQDSNKEVH